VRDLLVIVPSRGRPERLREFLSYFEKTREAVTDVAVAIDNDDPRMADYDQLWVDFEHADWLIRYQGPRKTITPWINYIAREELDNYRTMCVMGDDNVPITAGWDSHLVEVVVGMGGTGFAYPDDKRRNDIPELAVISTNIIKKLGWLCHPSLRHFYVDNVWGDLGTGADCIKYCPEVVIEHRHYLVNQNYQRDMTYAQSETHGMLDQQAYQVWRAQDMSRDVAAIRELIDQ
jgi:hypothetical protein